MSELLCVCLCGEGVGREGGVVLDMLFTSFCAISIKKKTTQNRNKAAREPISLLCRHHVPLHPPSPFPPPSTLIPPVESDWPLVLDWNWLHKGCNNERVLIFCQCFWRCVNGRDSAVTRTTRRYISVLCSSQIPKISLGLWSRGDTVFLIGSYWSARLSLMAAQSWWTSAWMKKKKETQVTAPSSVPSGWSEKYDVFLWHV